MDKIDVIAYSGVRSKWVFIILGAAGVMTIISCVFNWDWYFNSRKTRWMCDLFGRTAARIIHSVLGVIIIVLAVIAYFEQ